MTLKVPKFFSVIELNYLNRKADDHPSREMEAENNTLYSRKYPRRIFCDIG